MEELKEYLNQIIDVYNKYFDNDKRHEEASKLWTKYYKKSKELNINLEEAYNLYLMDESESYSINQSPEIFDLDDNYVSKCKENLQQILLDNESGYEFGISEEEAITLLKWAVNNSRKNIASLGVNMKKNSLNGFCELSQMLTIKPFEEINVKVTKNTANKSFDYPFNHSFGTVTIPINIDNKIINKSYLIDATYRQFFSTVRCNEGRYYTKEENYNIDTAPDPGYFVSDKEFAKELMKNGFIELNNDSAKKYGQPFYLSSLKLNEDSNDKMKNYYSSIMDNSLNYALNDNELDGMNTSFPCSNDNLLRRY